MKIMKSMLGFMLGLAVASCQQAEPPQSSAPQSSAPVNSASESSAPESSAPQTAAIDKQENFTSSSNRFIDGETLFTTCAFCHGAQAQGGPALDAPPLAGMDAWYTINQLKAFRTGKRGTHMEDIPGLQMSIVSGMLRNDETIKSIAEYLESLPTDAPVEKARDGSEASTERAFVWRSKYADLEPSSAPDIANGSALYKTSCRLCHGTNAEGNKGLQAPRLTNLPDWYQHRQLQYFQDGIRGTPAEGAYAAQMALFAKRLKNDQDIADVVAYVISLGEE